MFDLDFVVIRSPLLIPLLFDADEDDANTVSSVWLC